MNYFIFDIEVYPEWFCVVLKKKGTDDITIVTSDDMRDMVKLIEIVNIRTNILAGFNIKNYDLPILGAIINGWRKKTPLVILTAEIYQISEDIISQNKKVGFDFNLCSFTDLRDDLPDWLSLKEYESNKGLAVVGTNVPFGQRNLTDKQKKDTISYCISDVISSEHMLNDRWTYIQSKYNLAKRYGQDGLTAIKKTAPSVASAILVTNKHIDRTFLNRPITYQIPLSIEPYLRQHLPKWVLDIYLDYAHFDQAEKDFILFENMVSIGLGGLHSVHKSNGTHPTNVLHIETKGDRMLLGIDVTSYYPNLIAIYDYQSRATTNRAIFPNMLAVRTELKSRINNDPILKAESDSIKLALNSTGGALKQKYLPLFDPEQNVRMCFTGQLLLMALCNHLHKSCQVEIIQTNTDGVIMYLHTYRKREIFNIITEWETLTKMSFEYTPIKSIWQNNVNNYVLTTLDGDIKNVGGWLTYEIDPFHNIMFPIIKKALHNYLLFAKPINDTIFEEKDPLLFLYTVKRGATFTGTLLVNSSQVIECGKINRIYATVSPSGGIMYKTKGEHRRLVPNCPPKMLIYNEKITDLPPDLDYGWYIEQANKTLLDLVRVSL